MQERARRAILRLKEVLRRVALSESTIRRERRAGRFPQPVKLSNGTVGWYENEIDAWLANRGRC